MQCQVCDYGELDPVLSLGHMPPPNIMFRTGARLEPQTWRPVELFVCRNCELVQLGHICPVEEMFPAKYPYTSGTTQLLRDNFADLALEARARVGLKPDDLVIDIGSNDGTLLRNFNYCHTLGIEPTDVADIANRDGIETVKDYFSFDVAERVRARFGAAKAVTMANCFAHIDRIHSIVVGVKTLMAPDGVFITESHYLFDLIEGLQYDTIYHEHLRYYSLHSLKYLLSEHGLEIIDVKKIPSHGGSIRVYAAQPGQYPVAPAVEEMLAQEPTGVELSVKLAQFAKRVRESRIEINATLYQLRRNRERIAGIGAPSRASTLINYCGLDHTVLQCVYELSNSLKIGCTIPGTDIPIVDEHYLFEYNPDTVVFFSWHLGPQQLAAKLRVKGYKGNFIVPLPQVQVF